MKKEAVLYGAVGLLAGVIVTWGVAALSVNNNYTGMMNMMGIHTTTNNQDQGMMANDDMSMGQMMTGLQGKTGDDFDKTFLSEMIMHHQGAIDMANLAKTNAKHQEVKNMANDIITAQTKEIDQMKTWQSQWGYSTSNDNSHSMTGH